MNQPGAELGSSHLSSSKYHLKPGMVQDDILQSFQNLPFPMKSWFMTETATPAKLWSVREVLSTTED